MNSEVLIPGMSFARKYNLTQKEIEVLSLILEGPHSIPELSVVLEANQKTLHHIIQRLKLKNLLVLKNRDAKGTNLYEFNKTQIEK